MKSMNNPKNNIAVNLRYLRNRLGISQEEVAEKIGVSRQSVAKWENGESLPDILKCDLLASLFNVYLNELVRYDPKEKGIPIPPKDKHMFGMVTLGERGQIVLPKMARDTLNLKVGDKFVVLGDTSPTNAGIALIDSQRFLQMTEHLLTDILKE